MLWHHCGCCYLVGRPVCHERTVCHSACKITCSGSMVGMSSGGSAEPKIWSRCCLVNREVCSQCYNFFTKIGDIFDTEGLLLDR